ncbi:MAG: hypothetical protein KTR15_13915 [Phycisphaeraceae bacterium]|nr:hypothetical protein [Phycisphaeraceae bacterium]
MKLHVAITAIGAVAAIAVMLFGLAELTSVFNPNRSVGLGLLFTGLTCLVFILWPTFSPSKKKPRSSGDQFSRPECGYNMRGLTEAKCPECGSKFTLDQLKLK